MLQSIPAVLRVLFVFVVVVIATRKKLSLGHAFLLGAVFLGVMFGLNPTAMLQSILASVTHPKTLSLTVVILLILVFSHSMELAGQMRRLLTNFQGLVANPRLNLVVFPALIGLLPMPGGAIFSAPMVRTLGARMKLSGDQFSFINYWFRHIWEYWWPFYPGVLLTTTLANLNLWIFMLFLWPLTLVALCSGYWSLKNFGTDFHQGKDNSVGPDRPRAKPFITELSPILIVIGLGLAVGTSLSLAFRSYGSFVPIAKETGLIFALIVAVGWVWHKNRLSAAQRWHLLSNRQLLRMFYMVASIFIFKGILEASHAVEAMSNELLRWHAPLMPITVVLPFLVGVVTAMTIAVVGTTFPILIALIQSFGEGHFMLGYMMLGLASGFVGILFSPLHLCLVLSNEYFRTTLGAVYRYLWFSCVLMLVSSIGYFWILHWLNPF